jgi:phosphate transport system substrate-binding protein
VKRRSLLIAALAAWSCGGGTKSDKDTTTPATATANAGDAGADLTGAGATFPYPLYRAWISSFHAKTNAKVNYQNIGSGGGIKQLQEQTVDFGASDAPMTDQEIAGAKGGAIFHIPTVVGVVALAYNLPELKQPLKLNGPLIADIFLGKIKKWNDTRIGAINPGATLPTTDILVVHRSEGSGTTFIFTDFLAATSPAWKAGPGRERRAVARRTRRAWQ